MLIISNVDDNGDITTDSWMKYQRPEQALSWLLTEGFPPFGPDRGNAAVMATVKGERIDFVVVVAVVFALYNFLGVWFLWRPDNVLSGLVP